MMQQAHLYPIILKMFLYPTHIELNVTKRIFLKSFGKKIKSLNVLIDILYSSINVYVPTYRVWIRRGKS